VKNFRLLLLLLIVSSISALASAANFCPAPTSYCQYTNVNGCCIPWSVRPGYYCPELCD
jgi:hypothetical protein